MRRRVRARNLALRESARVLALVVIASVGCSRETESKGESAFVGSCNAIDRVGVCTSYGASADGHAERACAGRWSKDACPDAGSLGACAYDGGAVVERVYAKRGGPPSESKGARIEIRDIERLCERWGGDWSR